MSSVEGLPSAGCRAARPFFEVMSVMPVESSSPDAADRAPSAHQSRAMNRASFLLDVDVGVVLDHGSPQFGRRDAQSQVSLRATSTASANSRDTATCRITVRRWLAVPPCPCLTPRPATQCTSRQQLGTSRQAVYDLLKRAGGGFPGNSPT